jgi:hypothetical protein
MKRYPNPWVFGPAVIGMVIGGWLGYFIAELSGTGTVVAVVLAALAGLAAAVGVGIVAVLALRSFDEWKIAEERGVPPPGVGCEVPDPD